MNNIPVVLVEIKEEEEGIKMVDIEGNILGVTAVNMGIILVLKKKMNL